MSYIVQPTIKPHKTVSFKNYYNKQKNYSSFMQRTE